MRDVPHSCTHGVSSDSPRSACKKTGLIALGLISLLLPAAVDGQQTFTGGAISVSRTQTNSSSGTITISSPTGSSIATLKIVLNGLTTDGTACSDDNCWSLLPTSFYLQSPHGGPKLVLLGGTGDGIDGDDAVDAGSGLNNATITIQDGATAAPNDTAWTPKTGSFTVKPSSYFLIAGQTPPLGSEADFPQLDGTATFNSRFGGIGIADGDAWTLTIENGEGLTTPIDISSWEMTVTYASTTPTTTSVSSNVNPAFTTSPNNSVSLTATISTSSGTPTGTVAFTDNGNTISGCGAVALSGGHATCITTTLAQGYHAIEATYSGSGSYGQSSGSLTQLIEVHPTQSGNTWCNNTSFSTPLNGTGIVYPAVIPVSEYSAGSTVGNVTLELEGVTEPTELIAEFLLVAPGGANNLDFLDSAFHGAASGTNLFISDSASLTPNYGTPVSGDTYLPWDGQTQSIDAFPASNSPIVDSNIPLVPGTINYPATYGKTNALTLQQAFSGAPANGDWALYATASNGSNALTVGGWCVTLDLNSGIGTTTSLSSNPQKASLGSNVTLTATVTVQGSSTPVNSGTVEFKDETTGTVLASAVTLNGSGVAAITTSTLAEGDHKILASYSGNGSFNTSFATMYQRIDKTTVVTGSSPTWQFCNSGAITIPMGTSGAETPNPSTILVSNLPGTLNTATLTLNNFSILVGDQLDNTASLVVGPTGAALDFFSNTAGGTIEDEALAGNYVFADSASSLVPNGSGNISQGTYKPTSYVGTDSGTDVFTADPGGFFTLPGTFGYSASRGTSTFANKFSGTNPVGTWSLYFSSPNANATGTGAAGGWCLDLTENLPTVSVTTESTDTFTQGEQSAPFIINIANNGTNGPTGDPTGSSPMTVTDTLNSAFTFASGSGSNWSCTPSGQTVTCTNDSAIAEGSSYPTLTIDVNVSGSASTSGTIANTVSAAGAGAIATSSNTDQVTIESAPELSVTKSHPGTFTQGQTAEWDITVKNTASSGVSSGTVNVSDALPSGYTVNNFGSTSNQWNCSGAATVSCSTTLTEPGGSSFPLIQLIVNVPSNSPASVSNTARAWGGGDLTHTNSGNAVSGTDFNVLVVQAPASITINGGNNQSATVGTGFASPLSVIVKDAGGAIISNQAVTFIAPSSGASATFAASGNTTTVTTNTNGIATTSALTAGYTAGAYSVSISAGSITNSFSESNEPGPPASITVTSGTTPQVATVNTSFANPLSVTVSDAFGNPIAGDSVTFTAGSSSSGASGAFTNTTPTITMSTNGSGIVSEAFTANGIDGGPYTVTAADSSLSTTFSLSNVIANYLWIGNPSGTTSAFLTTGVPYLSSAETTGGTGAAIDSSGNVWSLNVGGTAVSEFTSGGTNTISGGGLNVGTSLAIDGSNQVWITNSDGTIAAFNSGGSPVSSAPYAVGTSSPTSIAIDISGNLWIANSASNSVTKVLGAATPTVPLATGVVNVAPATEP